MTTSLTGSAASIPRPTHQLEADAIGVTQDTVVGMASAAPAASVGLALAAFASATAYGSGPIILLTAIPMLVIAGAYRRLNIWNPNCGASFEWVGRTISPYLGFLTGWLMMAAYIVVTVSRVEILAPSVLSVFGSSSASAWVKMGIDAAFILIMLLIAIIGIRITARAQVGMAAVGYLILIAFSIAGLVAVFSHHHGTYPITKSWLSLSGTAGRGNVANGFLVAVFIFTGWDGTLYVNEEVKHRRTNPGRAAILAVVLLAIVYTISFMGLQGVVDPSRLQAHSSSAPIYIAQVLGGSGWARVMALSLALSVIATIGIGIVLTARIAYKMAAYQVLPRPISYISERFRTPVTASCIVGFIVLASTGVYAFTVQAHDAFNDVIHVTGTLFAIIYIFTALASIVHCRGGVSGGWLSVIIRGLLPLGAAAFLAWVVVQSLQDATVSQLWFVVAIIGSGIIAMFAARIILRSGFFGMRNEIGWREVSEIFIAGSSRLLRSIATRWISLVRDFRNPDPLALGKGGYSSRVRNKARKARDEISVVIYLDTDSATTITTAVQSVDDFVDTIGYKKTRRSIVQRGSFFRRSWAKIKKALTSDDIKELKAKAERAIELHYLDTEQADVDNKIAQSLSTLLASLADVPSACIRAGSILLIKYPGHNGPVVLTRNLSQIEILTLERFPEIQKDPRNVLESLALAISGRNEPQSHDNT